jgi:hypothetical protein
MVQIKLLPEERSMIRIIIIIIIIIIQKFIL